MSNAPYDPDPSDWPQAPPPLERRARRNPLASPWLTASLALIVVALVLVNVLISNLVRPPGTAQNPSASPTSSSIAAASPSPAGSPSFTRPTPTPLPTFMSYVVRPGDSLNSIATRFNTKARSIAWWNRGQHPNLDPESPAYNPGLIEVGWSLVLIPGVIVDEEHPPTPSPGPATPAPNQPTPAASPGSSASPSPAAGVSPAPS